MLLFSDGFDTYNIDSLRRKWGYFEWSSRSGSVPQIVSGMDTSVWPNQFFATKDGRALHIARCYAEMGTVFRPSRTVYTGFAVRAKAGSNGYLQVAINFLSGMKIERGRADSEYYFTQGSSVVATATLTIYPTYTAVNWTFLNGTARSHRINTTMDMLSGDYHYVQVAMTLNGNSSAFPQAWVEVRLGNRGTSTYLESSILTTLPDGQGKEYLNGIMLYYNKRGEMDAAQAYTTIDDFYLCNDEGAVNNSFLGNVKVRRMVPVADGVANDAVPVGSGYRFQCVDEDFIDTVNALPGVIPTPEQDPQFKLWEPGINDYLELQERGHQQLLRFTSVNYMGSMPRIYGVIMHNLAMAKYVDAGYSTTLKGLKKTGINPLIESTPTDIPVTGDKSYAKPHWQNYPVAFENDEVVAPGQPNQIWHPEILNGSEFGYELVPCEIDPIMYDPSLIRFSIITNEVVSEFLNLVGFSHRYFEESIEESLVPADAAPTYQYTWKVTDGLYFDVELAVYKTFPWFINETIEFDDVIPD